MKEKDKNIQFKKIRIRNLLSFGEKGLELELGPLNILIGANATGKSNLIEVFGLIKALPSDLSLPFRQGRGVIDWIWKGKKTGLEAISSVGLIITEKRDFPNLEYKLEFAYRNDNFDLLYEVLKTERPLEGHVRSYLYFEVQRGEATINIKEANLGERKLRPEDIDKNQSVFAQRRDPQFYPEITNLAKQFSQIKLYREWNLGRYSPPRVAQPADLPNDFLLEDASNLGLVLNSLQFSGDLIKLLKNRLKEFYPLFEDFTINIQSGMVQVFLREEGLREAIPATRLSDGMLRFLCLLSILSHPKPPPLICIEEPELGMHIDALPIIADMLKEASSRTQLVITTHSDKLVDEFSDQPEAVIVCERDEEGTKMRRLDKEKLNDWLNKYRLGELWLSGEIGGTRW